MALGLEEQEIVINSMRDEKFCTAYCSDTLQIAKFDKLVKLYPDTFQVTRETPNDKTYKFPKKLLSVRAPKKTLTEEQKRAYAERLKTVREKKALKINATLKNH